MSRIAAWKESITNLCCNRRLNVYEVWHKKETNPIAVEPRVRGERQTDGYRTCSDLSQCYRLSAIALLSKSGRIFKYRRVLINARKMSDCKVNNELTSNFLFNWRNQRRKLFSYWLKLGVKITCLVHTCLNSTNYFRKAEKAWKMMIVQAVHARLYRWQHWKIAKVYLKDGRLGVGAVAEEVSLDKESFRRILKEELNRKNVCAKTVPKLLSDE